LYFLFFYMYFTVFPHILSGLVWMQMGELFAVEVRNRHDAVTIDGDRLSQDTLQPDFQKQSSVHPAQGTRWIQCQLLKGYY